MAVPCGFRIHYIPLPSIGAPTEPRGVVVRQKMRIFLEHLISGGGSFVKEFLTADDDSENISFVRFCE